MSDISLPAGFDHGHIDDTKAAISELRGRMQTAENDLKIVDDKITDFAATHNENAVNIAKEFSTVQTDIIGLKEGLAMVQSTLGKIDNIISNAASQGNLKSASVVEIPKVDTFNITQQVPSAAPPSATTPTEIK